MLRQFRSRGRAAWLYTACVCLLATCISPGRATAEVEPGARAGNAEAASARALAAADSVSPAPSPPVRTPPEASRAGDSTAVHRPLGVADTVSVLPPVRVDADRSPLPERASATTVRLSRASLVRFQP